MIDTAIDNLMQERNAAVEYRDGLLKGVKEARARYQGPARSDEPVDGGDSAENVEFEYIAWSVSQCMIDVPQASIDSPILEVADEVLAQEKAMNRWIKDSKLRQPLLESYIDFEFAWGVLLVSRRPAVELGEVAMKGGTGVPYWPYLTRIPVEQAYKDHKSTSPYKGRFSGHDIVADKESLLAEARAHPEDGWNVSAIEAILEDSGLDKLPRPGNDKGPTRNEIVYSQMHVPDAEIDWEKELPDVPEDKRYLYNGRLFYFALCRSQSENSRKGTEAREIRDSQPYFGPASGPYVFYGEHVVPNCPYMMSTITPMCGSIKLLNKVVDVLNEGIKSYKKVGVGSSEDLAEIVTNGKNGHFYGVSDFDKSQVEMLELGGATNQMVAHEALLHDRVNRGLATDDAQRGIADDQASATAVAVAAENAGGRIEYKKNQSRDGVQRALEIAGFYLWYDEEFVMNISIQDAMDMGMNPADFILEYDEQGNPTKFDQPRIYGGTDKPRSYASLETTITPYSMDRMSDSVAARSAATLTSVAQTVGPMLIQMPWLQADVYLSALAKYTRIPEMRHLFNLQVAADMAQSAALAEYAASMAEQEPEVSGKSKTPASKPANSGSAPGGGARVGGASQPPPQKPQTGASGGMQGRSSGGVASQSAKSKTKGAA